MYAAEWLPHALALGIAEDSFWEMNPRRMKPYIEAYNIKQKRKDEEMWLMGAYVYEAFTTVMANVFSKHGHHKYRDKPFTEEEPVKEKMREATGKQLTEEEKQKHINNLFLALSIMQANFNINKQIKEENQE